MGEQVGKELGRLIAEAGNRGARIYPRCEVVDVDDVADGWVVCLVGRHNEQRVTWRGIVDVAVGDRVDVVYVPGFGFDAAYSSTGFDVDTVVTHDGDVVVGASGNVLTYP